MPAVALGADDLEVSWLEVFGVDPRGTNDLPDQLPVAVGLRTWFKMRAVTRTCRRRHDSPSRD